MKTECQNKKNVSSKKLVLSQINAQNDSSSVSSLNITDSDLPDFLNFKNFNINKKEELKKQAYESTENTTSAGLTGQDKKGFFIANSSQNITANIFNNTIQTVPFNNYILSSHNLPVPYGIYNGFGFNTNQAYSLPYYYPAMIQYPPIQPTPTVKISDNISNLKEKSKNNNKLLNYIKSNDVTKLKFLMCSSDNSDFFQRLIIKSSSQEKSELIKYIEPILSEIMTNHHGNFVIQVLFSNINYQQRTEIWRKIQNNIITYSNTDYSTYCIQVLIENSIMVEEEDNIMLQIKDHFMELANNKQGNHIIKLLLKSFKSKALEVLINFLVNNFEEISRNVYGISIIKKFIEFSFEENSKTLQSKIKNIIAQSFKNIVSHEYSHYSIIHIIDIWGIKTCDFIINKSKNVEFLVLKYNSRVVYKIIDALNNVSHIK
jgi:hypothetical protein